MTEPLEVLVDGEEPAGRRASAGVSPRLRTETDAVVVGAIEAVAFGLGAGIVFVGREVPLWGGGISVGAVAGVAAFIGGLIAAFVGYWRSRARPEQRWRLEIPPWKFGLDATTVALVHAVLAGIFAVAIFVLLQRGFEGLVFDPLIAVAAVASVSGASGYLIALSVSDLGTRRLAALLVTFMAVATLTSIATVADPYWWRDHFSQLGTADDFSAWMFNTALVVAGFFVATFSLYLHRDLAALVARGTLVHRWAPRFVSVMFIVLGLMLAGVGAFPFDVNVVLHNVCAAGMSAAFAAMVLGSPAILKGMPQRFFVICYITFAVLIGGFLLYAPPIQYYNLTAFELVAFAVIFGWILLFIRFTDAVLAPAAVLGPRG